MRPAAVLWDMDGTIVDTEPYWINTEYALVAEFGGEWDDEKAHSLVGNDLRVSATIIRDRGGVDLPIDDIVNRLLDGVIEQVRRKVPWRPGARELLASVRAAGVPNALVTMSWTRFAMAVVDALPPGTFDVVISGDEVTNGKPHPEPYLAAAAKLGVKAKDCVAIEDSPTGVRSAVAAGCRTYAVPNVVDMPTSREYTRINSLLELDLQRLGIAEAPRRRERSWGKLAVYGVVLAALAGGATYLLRRNETLPPLATIPISAWAPYWTIDDGVASVAAHGSLMRDVSPFIYEAKDATTIAMTGNSGEAAAKQLVAAIRSAGAEVLPSISDGMKGGEMAALLADPAARTQHVQAIVDLVASNGYDGIDLDYEGFAFKDPRSSWDTTSPNWISFLTELATALHADDKLLVVSVPPIYDTGRTADSGYWVYDYAAMGRVVDRIRVMAYDYSVDEAGPIAPYEWVRVAVKAAKRSVDDDSKVILGIGLYGRNWVVSTGGKCPAAAPGDTTVTLKNGGDLAIQRAGGATHDPVTKEAVFVYELAVNDGGQKCIQTREVHYIDEQGVTERIDLARAERIGGVSFWALGFDNDEIWKTVTAVAAPQQK